ncbi:MAG: CBS and ACT domain-containing protein [Desulfovibrionaceae bacterium]|nr:CBS and ACT domain-containing protein [Desulfovibrionaceae bacterium]
MLIRDWMTSEVVTVPAQLSMVKASRLMKEHGIRRLPVLDEQGALLGIVSDRDIKEASPSKATTLDMHELYYLLSEIKVKDIMTKNPLSVRGDDPVEQAAVLMLDRHIGGLPVVDEANRVIGIITDSDIFRVLIAVTGAASGGLQLAFELSRRTGALKEVLEAVQKRGAVVVSVLTSEKDETTRMVYIRACDLPPAARKKLISDMRESFNLLYWSPKI